MSYYNVLASSDESTVVAEYTADENSSGKYQSEAELEEEFIKQLVKQGYDYADIKNEDDMKRNLRTQLELLNDYKFTDDEWHVFYKGIIADAKKGVIEKTDMIQNDSIQTLVRKDGTFKNIRLIDRDDIFKNSLQVINQYRNNDGLHKNRYDVTVLVNGLPLVHIELKRRGVALEEAFNQIKRYQRESFWASDGIFEYVQIFVISNGTFTRYYANTTRLLHTKNAVSAENQKYARKTSKTYKFTNCWADAKNRPINDLIDFAKTFMRRLTLLNVITKYCVFTEDKTLLVMRPYQITQAERIIQRIIIASNYHKEGTIEAGGYVFSSTGSRQDSYKLQGRAAGLQTGLH